MCENDVPCFLNNSFTVWASWSLAKSWNMPMSSRKKNIHWWNNLEYSDSQLISVFGHIMLLNLDLTNCSNPRSQHCPQRLVQEVLGMMGASFHLPHRVIPDSSDQVTFFHCFSQIVEKQHSKSGLCLTVKAQCKDNSRDWDWTGV